MAYFDSVSQFDTLSPSLVRTGAQSFADSVTESKRFTDVPNSLLFVFEFAHNKFGRRKQNLGPIDGYNAAAGLWPRLGDFY